MTELKFRLDYPKYARTELAGKELLRVQFELPPI